MRRRTILLLALMGAALVLSSAVAVAETIRCDGDRCRGTSEDDELLGSDFSDGLLGLEGGDHLFGAAEQDHLFGGPGSDSLRGGTAADQLFDQGGNDTLLGGAGGDVLYAGKGDDTLDGGAGRDVYEFAGFWGNDTVLSSEIESYNTLRFDGYESSRYEDISAASRGSLTIRLAPGRGPEATDGANTVEWTEPHVFSAVVGGAHDDAIVGDDRGNTLSGMEGDDHISGGDGDDDIDGGPGADTIDCGPGEDRVYPEPGSDTLVNCEQIESEDAWEATARSDVENAGAAAFSCAADNGGSYVGCDTVAELQPYGFSPSANVTVNGMHGNVSDWSAAMQHGNGGSAFTYATFGDNAGQVTEAPRGTGAPALPDRTAEWEAAVRTNLESLAAAASLYAADNNGSYTGCTVAVLQTNYGFEPSANVTSTVIVMAGGTQLVAEARHAYGGRAYQYDTATGQIEPLSDS